MNEEVVVMEPVLEQKMAKYVWQMPRHNSKFYIACHDKGLLIQEDKDKIEKFGEPQIKTREDCTNVTILPELNAFATICDNGLLQLFDLETNEELDKLKLDSNYFISISSNNDTISACSFDGKLFIVKAVSQKLVLQHSIDIPDAQYCEIID